MFSDSSSGSFSVVSSDDWFFIFSNNVIWFWLDVFNSLDFIRILLEIFNVFNGYWRLFNVVNMFNWYRWLWDVLNVFNGDWWLRNVVNVRNSISWGLNPINVFNCSGWWLDVVDILNRVSWGNNGLVVRNSIRSLRNPFHMVNRVSWRNNGLEPFLRNWLRDDLLDVLNGDGVRLDPFDVFNGNILNGSNGIRSLRNPFSPFNVVRLWLKPFDVGNLV